MPVVSFKDKNYFQIFSLPESFDLNLAQLHAAYRQLQDAVHPDRHTGGGDAARLAAVQQSSLLNQAFDTLKSPLARAAYLLQLRGENVASASQADLGQDLLLEQIQLREQLEEVPRNDAGLAALAALRSSVCGKLEEREAAFAADYRVGQLARARHDFHAMQYLQKLLSEINAVEEELLGY